eukprot:scaffold48953_cov33-Tisochrysis_lutea.AAC.1
MCHRMCGIRVRCEKSLGSGWSGGWGEGKRERKGFLIAPLPPSLEGKAPEIPKSPEGGLGGHLNAHSLSLSLDRRPKVAMRL